MGQEIPAARMLLYTRALSDLSESQLAHGFARALKEFLPGYGVNFPMTGTLREWCFSWQPPDETQKLLKRAEKPDNSTEKERREYSRKLQEELQANLKSGKWQMPGGEYVKTAEALAAERNGRSEVPSDPEERLAWAKKKAIEQGWR
jgi:hypothetical protein